MCVLPLRWLGFCIGTGALALLAAACGGSTGPSATGTSAQVNGALAFSRCMRAHGVPSFPDPASNGAIPKVALQQLGVGTTQFQSAQRACSRLLPNGGQPTATALQQSWSDFRAFARCMRRNGLTTWPGPTPYPQHPDRPTFDLSSVGLDPSSPQVTTGARRCLPLLHGLNPQHLGAG
jgi:hypothetical protein